LLYGRGRRSFRIAFHHPPVRYAAPPPATR
jgi:hypothetical protein